MVRDPAVGATKRVLWGCTTSRTVRAHWALRELGLDYRCEPILPRSGETRSPLFTQVNPRQKIPVLQDGGFTITESAAIINYLSAVYGREGNRLVPTDSLGRARYDEWCFFVMTELDATSLYVIRRHAGLPEVYGEAPAAVEAAGAYFQRQVQTVNAALDDGRPWLLGDEFSGADMLLATCLEWALAYRLPFADGLRGFLERATARPAYAAALRANQPEHWGSR
jgi:glutathione S-transferase